VLRGEPGPLREQVVGAPADSYLALGGIGLPLLVEGHDDDAGPVVPYAPRLLEERALALLEADRVNDALALNALEPGLQYAPPRAGNHDRDAGDLRLSPDQVPEARRARDVGALPDHDDPGVRANLEGLQAAEPGARRGRRDRARRQA